MPTKKEWKNCANEEHDTQMEEREYLQIAKRNANFDHSKGQLDAQMNLSPSPPKKSWEIQENASEDQRIQKIRLHREQEGKEKNFQ